MAKMRILTQDKIDRYMNNSDELSELRVDVLNILMMILILPDCVSSNEDSDSDCENSISSQNTIQSIKKSDDDNELGKNISVREPF
ncbi:hypothetical protein TNIN_404821 [Trichonephila inaurata madagascariensis]|uniref:Uncharacterized protein n=1 Tax=Trichonephila inaurata madagascariensis TaxID=2747483 RepID=A0A8X6XLZ9_9ARAC|nr:hypothetical protein TNIN_42411 [Trichonephila inaurata madagascariensis]GFY56438.1 hypothetical protein TNIN_404821 [Trichonephila inaurata madagascariensis]